MGNWSLKLSKLPWSVSVSNPLEHVPRKLKMCSVVTWSALWLESLWILASVVAQGFSTQHCGDFQLTAISKISKLSGCQAPWGIFSFQSQFEILRMAQTISTHAVTRSPLASRGDTQNSPNSLEGHRGTLTKQATFMPHGKRLFFTVLCGYEWWRFGRNRDKPTELSP